MHRTFLWFGVSFLLSVLFATLVSGGWSILFLLGIHLPPLVDVDRGIQAAQVAYTAFASLTFLILGIANEARVARLISLINPPKEGEQARTTRLPLFPLHVAVFVSAILYLVLVGIEYRHEWVGGVVEMATLSFMLCFLLSIALFMSDPDHDIWGPAPTKKILVSIQEALKSPNP